MSRIVNEVLNIAVITVMVLFVMGTFFGVWA